MMSVVAVLLSSPPLSTLWTESSIEEMPSWPGVDFSTWHNFCNSSLISASLKKNFYSENIFHFAHKLSYFSYDVVTFLQHKAPQKWPRQSTVQTPSIKFICHPDYLENKFTHFDPKHARMQDSSMQQGYLCILGGGEKKYVIKIICEIENIWKRTILPFFQKKGIEMKTHWNFPLTENFGTSNGLLSFIVT